MALAPFLLLALLFADAPRPAGGVPLPPDGVFEADLTKAATERASQEMKAVLAELDKDASRPAAVKAEIKRKIARLKVAVYTTPRTVDETVTHYERMVAGSTFTFAERGLLADLAETARLGGFTVDDETRKKWANATIRAARWSRADGGVEVDIEDHLIDPRNGRVAVKTVVLITSVTD